MYATKTKISIFDHGQALFGDVSGRTLSQVDKTNITDHCLHGELSNGDDIAKWCDTVGRVGNDVIKRICESAAERKCISKSNASKVSEFLIYRKSNLYEIMKANMPRKCKLIPMV